MKRMGAFVALLALGAVVDGLGSDAGAEAAAPAAGRVVVVPIEGEIDLGLAAFVERVLAEAQPEDLVILDINTFGGRIDAAVRIRDALLAARAKTAAFIDPRAVSAGALISLATDTIAMTEGATIGAATPVQLEGGKMQPVEAKVVSYFRKEMKATAEAKGRRGDLAEAMVDASVEIAGLDGKDATLTLTTAEAIKYQLAAFQVPSVAMLCDRLGRPAPTVTRVQTNWAERLARWLSSSAVSSLLMSLGMLGIMLELWAPGHAVAGVLGVLCLLIFFFGHYVIHLAGWETLLLFGAGAVLLAVELVFFPGHTHGLLAGVGVLLIIASLVKSLVDVKHVPLGVSWSIGWLPHALTRVFGSLLATGAAMVALSRFLPRTRLGRVLVLEDTIGGVTAATSLLGRSGVADTALRPTGKVLIDGRRVDVVSEGEFVEPSTAVVVIAVDGSRIVVRRR